MDPVAPRDLLALAVLAAVVRDRQLVDPQLALADLCGDLRLDREIVLAKDERAEDVRAEDLVAGLHIGERGVEEHVREKGEEAVADEVPEHVHALRLAAGQA
jgi:hypothetical protein